MIIPISQCQQKVGQLLASDWTNDLISRVDISKDQRILKKT